MCPNGLAGVQDDTVCCAETCNGQCGGEGCGAILGTNGPSDCCSATILMSGVMCDQGVEAPCIMVNGTYTDAPAAAPINPILGVPATPSPSVGSRAIEFSVAPTAVDMIGSSVAPTATPTAGDRAILMPTDVPTAAPTDGMLSSMETSAPTSGSRDGNFGSVSPTTTGTPIPSELTDDINDFTAPPASTSGAPRASTGSLVTLAAIAGGIFAVNAARN